MSVGIPYFTAANNTAIGAMPTTDGEMARAMPSKPHRIMARYRALSSVINKTWSRASALSSGFKIGGVYALGR